MKPVLWNWQGGDIYTVPLVMTPAVSILIYDVNTDLALNCNYENLPNFKHFYMHPILFSLTISCLEP